MTDLPDYVFISRTLAKRAGITPGDSYRGVLVAFYGEPLPKATGRRVTDADIERAENASPRAQQRRKED